MNDLICWGRRQVFSGSKRDRRKQNKRSKTPASSGLARRKRSSSWREVLPWIYSYFPAFLRDLHLAMPKFQYSPSKFLDGVLREASKFHRWNSDISEDAADANFLFRTAFPTRSDWDLFPRAMSLCIDVLHAEETQSQSASKSSGQKVHVKWNPGTG